MIKFDKVSIKYINEYYSLYNINLEIDKNTLLLGDEASGNNFILRIIAKIDKNYEGNVFIDNRNLKDIKDKDLNLAYIPKHIYLFKNKSVFYNLMYPLKIRKIKKQDATQKIIPTLKKYNLINYFYNLNEKQKNHLKKANKNQVKQINPTPENENQKNLKLLKSIKVKNLNEPQQKLIMLLRAIVRKPKYILLENFLLNFDEQYLSLINQILKDASKTSIIVAAEQNDNSEIFSTFKKLYFDAGSIKK